MPTSAWSPEPRARCANSSWASNIHSKETLMRYFLLPVILVGICWGQGADECKPSALNIPGAPYPCLHADRRVTFRFAAPDAQKVQVRLGGPHDMTKGADGLWMV